MSAKYISTGEILRKYRRDAGYGSLNAIAEKLGVNHNTQGNYERGLNLPGLDYLQKFATECGCSFAELVNQVMVDEEVNRRVQDAPDANSDTSGIRQEVTALAEDVGNLKPDWITLILELRISGQISPNGALQVARQAAGIKT